MQQRKLSAYFACEPGCKKSRSTCEDGARDEHHQERLSPNNIDMPSGNAVSKSMSPMAHCIENLDFDFCGSVPTDTVHYRPCEGESTPMIIRDSSATYRREDPSHIV